MLMYVAAAYFGSDLHILTHNFSVTAVKNKNTCLIDIFESDTVELNNTFMVNTTNRLRI